jgi:hypothetical protein
MNTLANRWLEPATGASAPRQKATSVLHCPALVARYAKQWPLLLALLAFGGLLFAFQRVVHEGVRQGDLRRLAVATHADDLSRCNVISSRAKRAGCHALLSAAQAGHAPALTDEPLTR